MSPNLIPTKADIEIKECIDKHQSFSVISGAGSGKTQSLLTALFYIRDTKAGELRKKDQKILCITYTNRAVDVIFSRLNFDEIFYVSTIHSFLWSIINRFSTDIRKTLIDHHIPTQIAKKQQDDNGGNSKKAVSARERIASLQEDITSLQEVSGFSYSENSTFSNYSEGQLSHDDIIAIAGHLITNNVILQKIMAQKYPYVFVDEAQDTFTEIVMALNTICSGSDLPIVGYFGDPVQQIYDKRAGDFTGPEGFKLIKKEENFRCSKAVIKLLNSFRKDIQQVPAGDASKLEGSVEIRLVAAEQPEGPRKRYTDKQIERASAKFNDILKIWGLHENEETKYLFLVRQMIAKRLGFETLQKLFTGLYASTRTQEDYESGDHFLLKPFIKVISPLLIAHRTNNQKEVLDILRNSSPTFNPKGKNAKESLRKMRDSAKGLIEELSEKWSNYALREILLFCQKNEIIEVSERLSRHLERSPRDEDYNEDLHEIDKEDWLVDEFFKMHTDEIEPYTAFINDNTPYSTQHGVKGEEYKNVVVVYDDIEAAWNLYSFTKMLVPELAGSPTEGQLDRSIRLAYVSFSRAVENLRILLFTADPSGTKNILIEKSLFQEDQVIIN
ncbi:MAG: DNA helicase II [delta proteobacterium ML8_D]|nr:MAG: DNA helicase II [delta proteobacterium ML8_D]